MDNSIRFIKCTKEQYEKAKQQGNINENWFYYITNSQQSQKDEKNEEQI